jgi:hypothetical protein
MQTAAERKAAEAALKELVALYAPEHARLVTTVRRALQKRLPTAWELVYEYRDAFVMSFAPDERGYAGVLAIRGSEDEVRLYFNSGKKLPDPEKVLKGSGGLARYVVIEGPATLKRPAVATLIEKAIAGSATPFAKTGKGEMVVRTTTQQKRRRS